MEMQMLSISFSPPSSSSQYLAPWGEEDSRPFYWGLICQASSRPSRTSETKDNGCNLAFRERESSQYFAPAWWLSSPDYRSVALRHSTIVALDSALLIVLRSVPQGQRGGRKLPHKRAGWTSHQRITHANCTLSHEENTCAWLAEAP